MSADRGLRFETRICRQGILRVVDLPDAVAREFEGWTNPPVVVTLGGRSRATMLVPAGDGGFRLFLHDELRRAAGVDTGDTVEIEVRLDPNPEWPMPDDVVEAAAGIDRGLEALELLPPGLRREIIRFVESAKSPETRAKYLARAVELLVQRAAKLPDP